MFSNATHTVEKANQCNGRGYIWYDANWVSGCVMWMWVIWRVVWCPQSHCATQAPSSATASMKIRERFLKKKIVYVCACKPNMVKHLWGQVDLGELGRELLVLEGVASGASGGGSRPSGASGAASLFLVAALDLERPMDLWRANFKEKPTGFLPVSSLYLIFIFTSLPFLLCWTALPSEFL